MLRQGPVPAFLHGVVEYVAGVFLVAAPFLFGFESDAAMAVSIVLGIAVLAATAASALPTGLAKTIPVKTHVALDFATVAALVASPFLFGFSGESTPTAVFIVLGITHLLLTVATRFLPGREERTAS